MMFRTEHTLLFYFKIFLAYIILIWNIFFRTKHSDILKTIATEGKISDATDASLKKIVQDFMATFQG